MNSSSRRTLRRTGKLSIDQDGGSRDGTPPTNKQATSEIMQVPATDPRKMLHLMQRCQGKMHGEIYYRRGPARPWVLSACFIDTEAGSLVTDTVQEDGLPRLLVSDLRGCVVQALYDVESQNPLLQITVEGKIPYLQLRPKASTYFNAWFAALLCWQPVQPGQELKSRVKQQQPSALNWPIEEHQSKFKYNTDADAPVIKVRTAKLIQIENEEIQSKPMTPDRSTKSAQSPVAHSRRWLDVSVSLRASGFLRICRCAEHHTRMASASLPQLPRSAIQRVHQSVFDAEGVLVIYPQYAQTMNACSRLRPIFISFDTRASFEVWFVLLRAFALPELYGSERLFSPASPHHAEVLPGIDMSHTPTLLRIEQSLHVRINEARLRPPRGHTPKREKDDESDNTDQQGSERANYYAEILVDDNIKAKTIIRYEAINPVWYQAFELEDLKAMLTSVCIRIKRMNLKLQKETFLDTSSPRRDGSSSTSYTSDPGNGVFEDEMMGEIFFDSSELKIGRQCDQWWPLTDSHGTNVGEVSIRLLYDQQNILMDREYDTIWKLLRNVSNTLTQQIAENIPSELNRLTECLLNIFQVESQAAQWLMALAEEEIDSVRENSMNKHRFGRRLSSNESRESLREIPGGVREGLVRDLGKSAIAEANLLFRGNTLLSKTLDLHMKRIGREYLEETIGPYIRDIAVKDIDCEVDPVKVSNSHELQRNWTKLLGLTETLWTRIAQSSSRCPTELRLILRHIRACADDRYGDFLRTVPYSSVSCFLFLRFFCAAVLNPQLFGLLDTSANNRAHRTYVLVAKSLQGLANMSTFGAKEPWMEPMNAFLSAHRQEFKIFIDEVCDVSSSSSKPTTILASSKEPGSRHTSNTGENMPSATVNTDPVAATRAASYLHDTLAVSASYSAPAMIFERLPVLSREGFPSLPHLIDRARNLATLVSLWLEATSSQKDLTLPAMSSALGGASSEFPLLTPVKTPSFSPTLARFHEACRVLRHRTIDVRGRCEVLEKRNGIISCKWVGIAEKMEVSPGDYWVKSRGRGGTRSVTN